MSEGLEWPHFGSGELGRPLLAKASVPLWAPIGLTSILSENAVTQRGCGEIGLAYPVHGAPRESFP